MNINLNTSIQSSTVNSTAPATANTNPATIQQNPLENRQSLTVSFAKAEAASGIPEIPDEALTRDDALGQAVSKAFSLPAPPMPEFKE